MTQYLTIPAARYHSNAKDSAIREAEQKAHERKLAAYKLARKIREHRAQQKEQQFSDSVEASGNGESYLVNNES